ncbi:hypothetical protein ES332_A08G171500v1 [Gossypium tomentosum]|uniref:Uncharacterized protein n=1 Tax=Gossypium tomentosum TaxID=34277 RepID=A0A5D2PIU5_GOSTO|nr:hypothetical protein ES332_A08G171500v1 [Gossypium tomentosum]
MTTIHCQRRRHPISISGNKLDEISETHIQRKVKSPFTRSHLCYKSICHIRYRD